MIVRCVVLLQIVLFLQPALAQEKEELPMLYGQANLVGTSLSFSPSSLLPGEAIDLSGTILNNGTVSTISSFQINFFLSQDPGQPNFNYLLHSATTGALAANESRTIDVTGTVPNNVVPGQYYVWMSLDPLKNIPESNEDDNTLRTNVLLTVEAPPLPNLVGSSLSFDPDLVSPGDPLDLSGTVLNNGTASTNGSFQINFFLSVDPNQPNFSYLVHSFSMSAIGAGGSRGFNETGTIPEVPDGSYYVWMSLDVQQDIAESNEDDNRFRTNNQVTVVTPCFAINRSGLDFDDVLLNDSAQETAIVSNCGSIDLTISDIIISGSDADDFTLTTSPNFTLRPDRTNNVTVEFEPTTTGPNTATLTIEHNGENSPHTLELTGRGVAPDIAVSPESVDFGEVTAGDTASTTIEIENTGTADLVVEQIALSGQSAGQFNLTHDTLPFTIEPQNSNTFEVIFSPQSGGAQSAQVTISHNAPGAEEIVTLTGEGVLQPLFQISATSVNFGSVLVGTTGRDSSLTLSNPGTADLNITNLSISGRDANQFALQSENSLTLSPGDSSTIILQFTPNSTGAKAAALTITHNAAGSPHTVSLNGFGFVEAVISVTPDSLNFGSHAVASTAVDSVLIENTGTAELMADFDLTGVNAEEFEVSPSSLSLPPGNATRIQIAFKPLSAGDKTAALIINHNATGSPDTVSLAGAGVVQPVLSVMPADSLNFGTHVVADTAAQAIRIENEGTAELIANFEVAGENADEFLISFPMISLPPGNSTQLEIAFAPISVGDKIGEVVIMHNAPNSPTEIVLTGRGEADVPPDIVVTTPPGTNDVGSPVAITAQVTDNMAVETVNLLHRPGGSASFASVPMVETDGQYRGMIPATVVGTRGVEYFIEATDNAGNTDSSAVRFRASELEENQFTRLFVGGDQQEAYRLISFPLNTTDPRIATTLIDDLGQPDSLEWRLWEIDPGNAESSFPFRELFQNGTLDAGDAKFLISGDDVMLTSEPGTTITTLELYDIDFRLGWNMFSSPFDFNIPLENVEPASFRERIYTYRAGIWINAPPFLEPGEGYMFKRNSSDPNMLTIFPSEAMNPESSTNSLAPPEWQLQISASCRSIEDKFNFVGAAREATKEWDAYERQEPPPIDNYISLAFPRRDWKIHPDLYTTDFRPVAANGEEWSFEVKTNLPGEIVSLTFKPSPSLPSAFQIRLRDLDLQVEQDLRKNPSYQYRSPEHPEARRFALLVGEREFIEDTNVSTGISIPDHYELTQNFPNPFNPSTSIKFGLPQRDEVSLRIYNIRGEEIATLIDRRPYAAGQHAIVWDARDKTGQPVASGVYFYILSVGNEIKLQRKMTLLK